MTRILFRCDADVAIGGGHAMRCLALADAAAHRGAQCTFAVNANAPTIAPGLARHEVVTLEAGGVDALRARWPAGPTFDLLIVDHYDLHADFENAARSITRRLMVIDDLPDRAHACDMLLNVASGYTKDDFGERVPDTSRLLLGPEYALLRPEFASGRPASLRRRSALDRARRVFVSFGATDPHRLTERLLPRLLAALPDVTFEVLDGAGQGGPVDQDRVRWHGRVDNVAALMVESDMAIGAAGGTTWERAALGVPSLVVLTAPNQRPNARTLAETGAAVVLGDADTLDLDAAVARIAQCAGDPDWLKRTSEAAADLCDGRGCDRVLDEVDAILGSFATDGRPKVLRSDNFGLRAARPEDKEVVYLLQIEPGARRDSLDPSPPTWDRHSDWFDATLASPEKSLLMILVDDQIVGTIRLDELELGTEVSILVSGVARGRGIGREALRRVPQLTARRPIIARILSRNTASLRTFIAAGFEFSRRLDECGIEILEYAFYER